MMNDHNTNDNAYIYNRTYESIKCVVKIIIIKIKSSFQK